MAANTGVSYWKSLDDGFTHGAAAYGVTATMVGPQDNDADAELKAFQETVVSRPAGILVSVVDAERMQSAINAAIAAGIPVITVDSDAPASARLYFIGTNNFEAGHLGAERLVQLLAGKGNVVFYRLSEQTNVTERLKGYMDGLTAHPGIKVADVFDINGDPTAAFDKTREYLARTGNDRIDAFVSLDSRSGKEMADALRQQNVTDRTLIAMDTDADILPLIQSGEVKATLAQKPYTMGFIGLQALAQIHADAHGSAGNIGTATAQSIYPRFVDTGVAVVDKSNINAFTAHAGK